MPEPAAARASCQDETDEMTDTIDAHHHIWRQADLPWLSPPMQPRIFGPYEPIMRDYPISEYLDDLRGLGITKSVYVQANWAKDRFADEAAWVQQTADATGWPHAIVGYADFMVEDVRPQLDALARCTLMRGVRMQLHWHANPMYRFAARPDLPADATLQRNVARLADYGWCFDLQVFPGQMADAAALAEACPRVNFILQHAGMLEDTSEAGLAEWRGGMTQLASRPNVFSKLSGLGTFIHANDPAHIARIVQETVAIFGADRCLYGSNFPIEKLWTDYRDLIGAYRDACRALPAPAVQSIFHDTAARLYRL
jgi:predicted TIM-barrel fold metal-dependent hydrolase